MIVVGQLKRSEWTQFMIKTMEESAKRQSLSGIVRTLELLKVQKLSEVELLLFGFAMILGNRSALWNTGLSHGYPSLVFNLLYGGSGFICLNLCMGEMSSALPFSGGIFGFVRATLGPFMGFLVAYSEIVYCITTIVLRVQRLPVGDVSANTTLVIVSLGICLAFNLVGGKPIFVVTSLIGFYAMALLLIYLFGTLSLVESDSVDFNEYANPLIAMTWSNVMGARITTGSQYNGLQFLPLLSELLTQPRDQIPRVMLISCLIFIVMSVFVSLAAISQAPGSAGLSKIDLPLKFGLAKILNTNIDNAMWLDAPCALGAMFGLFYCGGRQLLAITKSGLLPSFFKETIPGSDTPYVCYTIIAVLGLALNLFGLNYPDYLATIRAISLIAAYHIFISCFVAYMVFRRKFSSMTRTFVNPLGDFAAIYGIINFLIAAVGVTFYSSIHPLFLVVNGSYLIFATIFFWTYLVHHQKFSEEEKKVMFKAYLINANRNMRKNRLKNNKVGPSSDNVSGNGSRSGTNNNTNNGTKVSKSHAAGREILSVSMSAALSVHHEETIAERNPTTDRNSPITIPYAHDSSNSVRKAELDASSSTRTTKMVAFLSSKFNAVVPLLNNMDEAELNDYEQLAALSSGGMMDDAAVEELLQIRFGLKVEGNEKEDEEL